MKSTITLVLGGARSGKSLWAEQFARRGNGPVLYVATAQPSDDEMAERIANHRANRPADWTTLEVPVDLLSAIRKQAEAGCTVLVDCLTIWVSNAILARIAAFEDAAVVSPAEWRAIEADLVAEVTGLAEHARRSALRLILVSNEVGLGLVPPYPLGRAYRDILGRVNSGLAERADNVIMMVAGLPIDLKRFLAKFPEAGRDG